jgi:hypothetical protein
MCGDSKENASKIPGYNVSLRVRQTFLSYAEMDSVLSKTSNLITMKCYRNASIGPNANTSTSFGSNADKSRFYLEATAAGKVSKEPSELETELESIRPNNTEKALIIVNIDLSGTKYVPPNGLKRRVTVGQNTLIFCYKQRK